MELKFTQEVKDNWIKALESGNFKQGYHFLVSDDLETKQEKYCCIGVLGEVTEGLSNKATLSDSINPYRFLEMSGINLKEIWTLNDRCSTGSSSRPKDYKDDYSNVLEHIKALPIQN